MKKLFALITVMVLSFTVVACGGRQPEAETVPTPLPQENNNNSA